MLFLTFFPTHNPPPDLSSSTASLTSTSTPPKRRDAVTVGSLILLSVFIVGLASIAMVATEGSGPSHARTQTWADFLGTVAGTLAAIQYVPQIYFTWRLKDVKSLSIVTMIIQVPGAFLFAFSLWLRVGWRGWSTWLVYVVTGILQGILLFLAVTYFLAARQQRLQEGQDINSDVEEDERAAAAGATAGADERTALLANGNKTKTRDIHDTQRSERSDANQRQLSMLYAATPPEHDSDRS